MTIAITFPGKMGDLLWALPTVRAISRTYNVPVTLYVSQYLAPIVPLLNQQPYIMLAITLSHWEVQFGAPVSPRTPPGGDQLDRIFDKVFHLGHEGWPMSPLPFETLVIAGKQTLIDHEHFSLTEPWITVTSPAPPVGLVVGFTDEHFELKVGLTTLLQIDARWAGCVIAPPQSRWATERPHGGYPLHECGWLDTARLIRNSTAFLGCCSALHVLSAAMGKPTIVVEPNPHRHHPIFWPYGTITHSTGHVMCVLGGDGKPTFDARHTREQLERFL